MILTAVNRTNSFLQFVIVLFLFIAVLAVTLWVSRWVAGYQKDRMTGSNMEVIDTMRISNTKYVQILRIGEKYIAVAVCKDTVTTLMEIPAEQIHMPSQQPTTQSFKEFLELAKNKTIKKSDGSCEMVHETNINTILEETDEEEL